MSNIKLSLTIKILGYIPIGIVIIFNLLNWTNHELIMTLNNMTNRLPAIGITIFFLYIMKEISEKIYNKNLKTKKGFKKLLKYISLTIIGVMLISLVLKFTNIEFIKRINYFITETNEGPYILLVAILIFFELLEPFEKEENHE